MNQYFITYCFYIGFILFLFLAFGFGFHFLVVGGWKSFSSKFGAYAYLPRYIGTPFHELGHLLFAVLTGSKIKGIRLFPKMNRRNQTCGGGYVRFIPRNNLLGSISCFLSGIGPMIFCPFVILVSMYLLVPEFYLSVIRTISQIEYISRENIVDNTLHVLQSFFQCFHITMFENWQFWLFLLIAIPTANECVLSSADIYNAGRGFLVILCVLIGFGFLVSFQATFANEVIIGLAKASSLLLCTLCLSLVFNLIHFVAGKIVAFLL